MKSLHKRTQTLYKMPMRSKTGIVTSARMQQTVVVTVHRSVLHPKYAKRFRLSRKFLADTNGFELGEGDTVAITECRPLSKRKYFQVIELRKKAPVTARFKAEEVERGLLRDHRDTEHEHQTVTARNIDNG